MAAMRIIAILIMVLTVILAWASPEGYEAFGALPNVGTTTVGDVKLWINFSGLPSLIPVAIFSQMIHHSIPVMVHAMSTETKARAGKVFSTMYIITTSAYIGLGTVIVLYFALTSKEIYQELNLDWSAYYAHDEMVVPEIVKWFLLLFPALDILSTYPLHAITLGNNLECLGSPSYTMNALTSRKGYRWRLIIFRLVAATPPVVSTLFMNSLGRILSYVGLLGFLVCFLFPTLLVRVSRRMFLERYGDDTSMFTSSLTRSDGFTTFMIVLCLLLLAACFTFLILHDVGIIIS